MPVYVKALGDPHRFFAACCYRCPPVAMTIMFKRLPLFADGQIMAVRP